MKNEEYDKQLWAKKKELEEAVRARAEVLNELLNIGAAPLLSVPELMKELERLEKFNSKQQRIRHTHEKLEELLSAADEEKERCLTAYNEARERVATLERKLFSIPAPNGLADTTPVKDRIIQVAKNGHSDLRDYREEKERQADDLLQVINILNKEIKLLENQDPAIK